MWPFNKKKKEVNNPRKPQPQPITEERLTCVYERIIAELKSGEWSRTYKDYYYLYSKKGCKFSLRVRVHWSDDDCKRIYNIRVLEIPSLEINSTVWHESISQELTRVDSAIIEREMEARIKNKLCRLTEEVSNVFPECVEKE